MKNIFVLSLFSLFSSFAFAQSIYTSESAEITFFSKAPLEDIAAVNKAATSLLTPFNDSVVFLVPIKGFTFHKPLMQEHFNENYMESHKAGMEYAKMKGKINEKIDWKTDGEHKVTCSGMLLIHGVEQPRNFEGTVTILNGKPSIKSEFKVKLADHKIKIPKAVIQNIAEEVLVTVIVNYKPYEKP